MKEFLKSVKKRYIVLAILLQIGLVCAASSCEGDEYEFQQPIDQIAKIELFQHESLDDKHPPVLCKTIVGEDVLVFMQRMDQVRSASIKRHQYDPYMGLRFVKIYYKNGDTEWIGGRGVLYTSKNETREIYYAFYDLEELFIAELAKPFPVR